MQYIKEESLEEFLAWSGACYTWEALVDRGDIYTVEELIESYHEGTGDYPTETEINDFLWFERDTIAEYLGYQDWFDYTTNKKPVYPK